MSDELINLPSEASLDKVKVPPQLVEEVQNDPDALTRLTRGQLLMVQDRMFRKVMTEPDVSIGQLTAVHEQLSKNARADKTQQQTSGGQQVVINIIRAPGKDQVTIEGEAKRVEVAE